MSNIASVLFGLCEAQTKLKLWITTSKGLKSMVRIPTNRQPTHPGEMLLEEFLAPMGITQRELADSIQVSFQRINEIVNGHRGITPQTALRFAKYFGNSADFWLNLQLRWDLYQAQKDEENILSMIQPHKVAA